MSEATGGDDDEEGGGSMGIGLMLGGGWDDTQMAAPKLADYDETGATPLPLIRDRCRR